MKIIVPTFRTACSAFLILALNSCVKTSVSDSTIHVSINKVQKWIDQTKLTKSQQSSKLAILKSNLKFNEIRIEQLNELESILIIPIDELYKKEIIGSMSCNAKPNLLVAVNKDGEIAYGQIVFFYGDDNSIATGKSGYSTFNFGNPKNGVADGKYVFYSLLGARLKELKFVNGFLREQGIVSSNKGNLNNTITNNVKLNSGICTQWYLVTTYYDESGNVIGQSSQYLYTTGVCDGSVPQGDYQVPQQEQNVGAEEIDRTALNIFDTNPYIPGNDTTKVRGSVYLHGSYGIFDAATWQGSMGIKLTSNWIYMETSGYAKFVNSPAPLATASYTGAITSPTNSSFPVGTTITYTYAQAFHL